MVGTLFQLPWTPLYTQASSSAAAGAKSAVGGFDRGGEDDHRDSLFTQYALAGTIAFTVGVYVVELYLDARQRRSYQSTTFPDTLAATVAAMDQDNQNKNGRRTAAGSDSTGTKMKIRHFGESEESSSSSSTEGKKNSGLSSHADDNVGSSTDKGEGSDANRNYQPLLLPQLVDKFAKAQSYGLDKIHFGMIASTYDTIESIAFLLLGFVPYMWDISVRLGEKYFGITDEATHEIHISLLFLLLTTLFETLKSLPFELYSTFEIERKHGFNKQTLGLFVSDKIKSVLLSSVLGGPFVALLLYIIQKGGDFFYIYVWALLFGFSLVMMTLVPVLIMPLFNTYEPLPDGGLKTRIYALADRVQYPLTKLFVMDGSTRSSHSNAFMFGFGRNKRIVLYDTLLQQVQADDEILAILGHELGHWKLGHTLTNFVVTQLYFGVAFYFFARTYGSQDLYAAFGFNDPHRIKPTLIALLLFFQTLWAPVDKALSFILTVHSRMNEFAADKFSSHDLGYAEPLQSGLCKIHLENLGAMCTDPWYSTYHYSHPPLVERLSAIMMDADAADKKKSQ